MFQPPSPAPRPARVVRTIRSGLFLALVLAATFSAGLAPGAAAPDAVTLTRSSLQNVDYLDADTARRLDLDFPVLVPSYVPAPFSGAPAVRGGGGFYSLYWMVPGAPPTFLNITGEVGGSLPAGSRDDFNNELFINDTVRGVDAIHEVTSTYDDVWWIADGVLYSVQSLNVQGTDSRGLANNLIALEPPPPATEPVDEETPEPTQGAPGPTDPARPGNPPVATREAPSTNEAEPPAQAEPTVTTDAPPNPPSLGTDAGTTPPNQDPEPANGGTSSGRAPGATPSSNSGAPTSDSGSPATPEPSLAGSESTESTPSNATPGAGSAGALSDGTGASLLASDGTGGAAPPIAGSDGTGGTTDLTLTPVSP
ncbi:MAG: hypothetical protein AVDCRST_MAG87-743 [uncultured Thermomicrobiales bacterium]|uniref:DUF4367 domain-containing protein n=1 Tax=uncultured Thermomicrobiales bacterium TaxID=1645740 RepID=A0A6J4UH41_9BACT|nr:MAG: hypothetical protein AVDCRST_MAG87-743 [uncultured Thermomicrobiales bacterium]